MAEIRLSGIDKVYPGGTHAVHSVDLQIADGEFMIMVGPSGCAKSTILRMIAGLETPTGGTIEIGGRVVNDVAPKDRDIAMVFQSYALYPHMTVRENMAFGLRLRNMPPNEIDQRVAEAARILGLESLLDRLPKAMSGGQRQRVAMGRAIVREPQAFLMDEPLSNLDAKLRVQMRTEIAKLHQRLGTTTVYVTHDQVEALTLGQRICILRKGVVQQVDTPFHVYQNPANIFVGGFIGSPGMNFMRGRLTVQGRELFVQLGEHLLAVPQSVAERLLVNDVDGRAVAFGIRPEHMELAPEGSPDTLPIQVELVESMGAEQYVYFSSPVEMPDLSALSDTQAMSSTFTARLDAGARVHNGANLALRLDMDEVHLFDPTSMFTLLAPAVEADVQGRRSGARERIVVPAAPELVTAAPAAPAPPKPMMAPMAAVSIPAPNSMHVGETGMLPSDLAQVAAVFDQPAPASAVAVEPLQAPAPPPEPVAQTGEAPAAPARGGFAARPMRAADPNETVAPTSAQLDEALDAPVEQFASVSPDYAIVEYPQAPPAPAPPEFVAEPAAAAAQVPSTGAVPMPVSTQMPRDLSSSAFRSALSRMREPNGSLPAAKISSTFGSFQPPRISLKDSSSEAS